MAHLGVDKCPLDRHETDEDGENLPRCGRDERMTDVLRRHSCPAPDLNDCETSSNEDDKSTKLFSYYFVRTLPTNETI